MITTVATVSNITVNKILFTNTYALFRKVMADKKRGESLSECMNYSLSKSPYVVDNFFEMSSSIAMGYFNKNSKLHYKALVEQIEEIYCNGTHYMLETSLDQKTKLIEVFFNEYFYSFLVDFRVGKQHVVILTNFYSQQERYSVNRLFANNTYCQKVNSTRYGKLTIINTYNAFCNYAAYCHSSLHRDLNKVFFPEFLKENGIRFQYNNMALNENDKIIGTRFSYVQFRNAVIIYEFEANAGIVEVKGPIYPVVQAVPVAIPVVVSNCPVIKNEPYEEEDMDYIEENEAALRDLEEWGAFTDEGIYPSDWE